ncbi:MAG: PAS domain S-box protein [Microscillaceae bacterium]|nr:PAS domain S-box protein [Microscillaceae bacterium]MDW8461473.1 PAS domain S-box protein [Cytophagales bacterium]
MTSHQVILSAIAHSSSEIMILVSREFEVLYYNRAAQNFFNLLDLPKIEVGTNIWNYIKEDFLVDFTIHFAKALAGTEVATEVSVNIKGKRNYYLLRYSPTYEPSSNDYIPKLLGVLLTGININQQKENEILIKQQHEELLASEEELRQNVEELMASQEQIKQQNQQLANLMNALENSTILSITDRKGRIIKANKQFCEISKYTLSELLGQDHRIINSGYHSKEFWANMWKTITQGKVWQGEVKNKAKDGSYYWVHSVNNPIFDTEGNIVQFFSIRFLITERKEAEEKIKAQNKLLQEIAFVQSHIIRRPVANILGLINLLKMEKDNFGKEMFYTYLDLLEKAARETDEVVSTITERINELEEMLGLEQEEKIG